MPKVARESELTIMEYGFIVINIIHCVAVIVLTGVATFYFGKSNIGSFLPIDVISLLISVIILSFIIAVVGWAAALSNTGLGWIVFHCCMGVLLIIEVLISLTTSNPSTFTSALESSWTRYDDQEIAAIQSDLTCCGLQNMTDRFSEPCPQNAKEGCAVVVRDIFITIRWFASTAMFVCFMFGLFIDLAGYAMCIHPDLFTLEDQQNYDKIDPNLLDMEEEYVKPWKI